MKAIKVSPSAGSIVLATILLILFLTYGFSNESLSLFIGVYGSFVATVIGLYISLHYDREKAQIQEDKVTKVVMLGSLQLLWSELDLNSSRLKNLLDGYISMPKENHNLYDYYKFLGTHSNGMKFKIFYGLISSGDMKSITKEKKIFNSLQHAYYNIELWLDGLILTELILKDFDRNYKNLPEEEIASIWKLLDKEIENLKNAQKLVNRAKAVIEKYLNDNGIILKGGNQE